MNTKRFDIFIEKHIGFGVRWQRMNGVLMLSIAMPFVSMTIAIGTLDTEVGFNKLMDRIRSIPQESEAGDECK